MRDAFTVPFPNPRHLGTESRLVGVVVQLVGGVLRSAVCPEFRRHDLRGRIWKRPV
jgi:methyl coenzyme M reductase subunit C